MISSINTTHAKNTEPSSPSKGAQPKPQTQQKGGLPQDAVKLNSTAIDKPGGGK